MSKLENAYGVDITSLQMMKFSKWISYHKIAINTLCSESRKALVFLWLHIDKFNYSLSQYEQKRSFLSRSIVLLNSLHHLIHLYPFYYDIMRLATSFICEKLSLADNLKNREDILNASTISFRSDIDLHIKYNLHKDNSPVWDLFRTEYERTLAIKWLADDKYNAIKTKGV